MEADVAHGCGRSLKSPHPTSCGGVMLSRSREIHVELELGSKAQAQPPVARLVQEVPLLTNSTGSLKQCHHTGPSVQTHELCVGEGLTPELWQVATSPPCSPDFPQDCSLPVLGSLPIRTPSFRHSF